jgi:antitoxin MazE
MYILILEVTHMYTTIQKWGNSQAVRLPKGLLEDAAMRENDRVEIKVENGCIIISRINKKHKTIEERLADYNGDYRSTEWDTGNPRGKEVW